ncbi:hypothetical protein JH26_18050 [Microvirga sp. BSC39]|nr:hypothetical protein JH26_18050 [Microvirga sp. BSC39]
MRMKPKRVPSMMIPWKGKAEMTGLLATLGTISSPAEWAMTTFLAEMTAIHLLVDWGTISLKEDQVLTLSPMLKLPVQ